MLVVGAPRRLHALVNQDDLRQCQVLDSRVETEPFGPVFGHEVGWIQISSEERNVSVVQQSKVLTLLLLDLSIDGTEGRKICLLFGIQGAFPILSPAGHQDRYVLPKVGAESPPQLRHHLPGAHGESLRGVHDEQDHVGVPRFLPQEFGALVPLLGIVLSPFGVPEARRVHQGDHASFQWPSKPPAGLLGGRDGHGLLGIGGVEPILTKEEVPGVGLAATGGADHYNLLCLFRSFFKCAPQRGRRR
mmetsp:Transcript_39015/g.102228  ORF Transcript_39015/g.102228 Transcript_39015/m.102228 type:complete len:246 (-) Transcript_39015:99-836(-)